MESFDLVDIGACTLGDKTKALLAQCKGPPVGDDETDAPDYGDTPVFSALGVTSMPYPKTAEGNAQGVVALGVPGCDGALIGMRDTRTAKIVGNLKPGDTVLHSTGPKEAAQVQLKEDQQIAAIVTKDSSGNTVALNLDGLGDQVQLITPWGYLEYSKANGVVITDETGKCAIQMKNGIGSLMGTWVLGGRKPLAPILYSLTPVVGTSGTATPAPGLFIGV